MGQAVIATDLDGTIRYWNAAAERLYGWTATEVLGRNVVEMTVPQMSQRMAAEVMASLRVGNTWSGGFSVKRRDGSVFPALVTDAGVYAAEELVGIIGVSTNVGTALAALLERSSDAALVLTGEGVIRYASPAVGPLFGWRPDDLPGTPFSTLIDARDLGQLHRVLFEPLPHPGPVLEFRVRAASGPTSTEATFTDLRDDPDVLGFVCNLRHSERLSRLRERARLSETVHADLLQTLFTIRLDLAIAQRTAGPIEHARLESAGEKLGSAIVELRRLLAPDGNHTEGEIDGSPDPPPVRR
jgi:PAS domain S-box-containing protein